MGQKTNPIGLRLGIIKGWDSYWYGGKDFSKKLVEEDQIRKYLKDAWLTVNPDGTGTAAPGTWTGKYTAGKRSNGRRLSDGMLDMSGRIDHIFLSENFKVVEAQYLPAPASASDHPVYWVMLEDTR